MAVIQWLEYSQSSLVLLGRYQIYWISRCKVMQLHITVQMCLVKLINI
jgi:hypothetical protein